MFPKTPLKNSIEDRKDFDYLLTHCLPSQNSIQTGTNPYLNRETMGYNEIQLMHRYGSNSNIRAPIMYVTEYNQSTEISCCEISDDDMSTSPFGSETSSPHF